MENSSYYFEGWVVLSNHMGIFEVWCLLSPQHIITTLTRIQVLQKALARMYSLCLSTLSVWQRVQILIYDAYLVALW